MLNTYLYVQCRNLFHFIRFNFKSNLKTLQFPQFCFKLLTDNFSKWFIQDDWILSLKTKYKLGNWKSRPIP